MLWVGGWRLESKIYPFCRPVHKIVTVLPGGSFPARVPFARTPIHMTCTAWCNQCHSIKSIYLRKVGRFSLKSEFPAVWVSHPPEKLKHFPEYQYNVKHVPYKPVEKNRCMPLGWKTTTSSAMTKCILTNDEGLNKLGAWCLYEAPRRDHKRPKIGMGLKNCQHWHS